MSSPLDYQPPPPRPAPAIPELELELEGQLKLKLGAVAYDPPCTICGRRGHTVQHCPLGVRMFTAVNRKSGRAGRSAGRSRPRDA